LKPGFVVPEEWVVLKAPRHNDTYRLDMTSVSSSSPVMTCLLAKSAVNAAKLWHKRLAHVNFKNINNLVRQNLVEGLPDKEFKLDDKCVSCGLGKIHKKSHKLKMVNTIDSVLHLLHMDLFGPISIKSVGCKSYCLVVTNDFS